MNILIVENPWSGAVFREALNKVFENPRIVGISEFRKVTTYWFGEYRYNAAYDTPTIQNDDLFNDIICRDRSLCIMEKNRALRLVERCWNGVNALFANGCFDYVFSTGIDRYTTDIVFRVAELNGVPAISPFGSFIPGYAWFTRRGERISLGRNVSRSEAERVYTELTAPSFLPESEVVNIKRTHRDIKRSFRKRALIEHIYYPMQSLLSRDPDNTQYNLSSIKGQRLADFYRDDLDDIFEHVQNIQFVDSSKTVYLPMHLIPEATTSYWCKNVARLGYLKYLTDIIDGSDPDITFLIKEHPAMYGKRRISFYEALLTRKNTILVHPLDRSNDLLDKVETVVVDTGTVGVEVLLRNKRALCVEDSYYSSLHPNAIRCERISKKILQTPLTHYDNVQFVCDLLDGMFVSDYQNGKRQGFSSADELAEGFHLFLNREKSNDSKENQNRPTP